MLPDSFSHVEQTPHVSPHLSVSCGCTKGPGDRTSLPPDAQGRKLHSVLGERGPERAVAQAQAEADPVGSAAGSGKGAPGLTQEARRLTLQVTEVGLLILVRFSPGRRADCTTRV